MTQRGSIFQRANGRWVASMRVGSKTIQRYGISRSDAEAKLGELLREHFRGTLSAPTKVTLSDWFEQWLDERELRPSAVRTYRQALTPVLADVGTYRLDKLTPVVLSLTVAKLAKRGVGARSRQLAYGYLKSCLSRAVELDMIGQNPMLKVRRPEWQPRARTYWTTEEATRFVAACHESPLRWSPLFAVLVSCGLRVSEALGLQVADIDLKTQTLHVRRALVWAGGEFSEGAVKTRSGYRTIGLPSAAVRAFELVGLPSDAEAPIFRTASGKPPSLSQLRRPFLALCKSANVPPINLHGARHVHAALVYRSTRDVYAVKARLGHSDVSFTMRQYGYGTHSDADTARAIDELLGEPHDQDD